MSRKRSMASHCSVSRADADGQCTGQHTVKEPCSSVAIQAQVMSQGWLDLGVLIFFLMDSLPSRLSLDPKLTASVPSQSKTHKDRKRTLVEATFLEGLTYPSP